MDHYDIISTIKEIGNSFDQCFDDVNFEQLHNNKIGVYFDDIAYENTLKKVNRLISTEHEKIMNIINDEDHHKLYKYYSELSLKSIYKLLVISFFYYNKIILNDDEIINVANIINDSLTHVEKDYKAINKYLTLKTKLIKSKLTNINDSCLDKLTSFVTRMFLIPGYILFFIDFMQLALFFLITGLAVLLFGTISEIYILRKKNNNNYKEFNDKLKVLYDDERTVCGQYTPFMNEMDIPKNTKLN